MEASTQCGIRASFACEGCSRNYDRGRLPFCFEAGFSRPFQVASIASRRCCSVVFAHLSFASFEAAMFFGDFFFFGPHRARAASLISLLRSFADTFAQRLAAPRRPPSLWAILTGFFFGKPQV